ncbi:hypothetical protein DFP72DRAFT_866660 [Ephemerocybe angulata]|uniref:Uncharacterized protein n=1 Tax=Ephemerocybe angulata TaxID=980116 RepID=A0A8H6IIT3_9AGAR|nr:hypothetical protein DFP72DRAFT_866660 [Tulosesus angulatus]
MVNQFTTPRKRAAAFKRTESLKSQFSLANSSDTEEPWTPPRKRFRFSTNDGDEHFGSPNRSVAGSSPYTVASSSSPASSLSNGSPSKKRRRTVSTDEYDLTSVLRRCNNGSLDALAIRDVKVFPRAERDALEVVRHLLTRSQSASKSRLSRSSQKILETELYLEWLSDLNFVISAIENLLSAKIPGTRKRVTGLGRLSFTILYTLMDEFIEEVDRHHDGWSGSSGGSSPGKAGSPRSRARPCDALYPQTMTIIEESQDSSTDARMAVAVEEAEELLARYDLVMADAVRRYKIECGRNNDKLADAIGSKEYALSRACCLLCEQTGFGGDEDGDSLLREARTAMVEWKEEFGSERPDEDDELTSD